MRARSTAVEPSVRQSGGETEYLWESEEVAALEFDGNTPGWYEATPKIQLSEFASWEDVTRWAEPLYKVRAPLSPALKRQIEEWRSAYDAPASRLLAALRFVQEDVCYLGIEMGPHSHLPAQPSIVFDRRYGDCKDKSLLLATILNALGIEARPALVNTQARHTIDEWQPSPFAFNHMIVQVKIDGKTMWFDATATHQRGSLEVRHNPEYTRALLVKEGGSSLEEIERPDNSIVTTHVKEIYTINSYYAPARLEIVTTYMGGDADGMRGQLAEIPASELGKSYLNYYAETYPGIMPEGDLVVRDDEEANTIVTMEKYVIPSFWKDGSRLFSAERINVEVTRPGLSRRSQPLAVTFPVSVAHVIEINLPEYMRLPKDSESVSDEAISFRFKTSLSGKKLKLEYYYTSLRDHVPAERAAKHLESVGKIQKVLGYELFYGSVQPDWAKLLPALGWGALGLPVLVAGIVIGVVRVRSNRRGKGFQTLFQLPQGAGPETAIPVYGEMDLNRHLTASRCGCGGQIYRPGAPFHQEGFTFNGRRLAAVRLR